MDVFAVVLISPFILFGVVVAPPFGLAGLEVCTLCCKLCMLFLYVFNL